MAKSKVGFLPCFSKYKHEEYPIRNLYQRVSYVNKVKVLISAMLDSQSPYELKKQISQEVVPIRPTSAKAKQLIKLCNTSDQIYRIDYGDNPFRIVFDLSNKERLAHIHIIDTKHSTLT